MIRLSHHTATLASVSALILGGAAVASAAPELFPVAEVEDVDPEGELPEEEEVDPGPELFEEEADTPEEGIEEEVDPDDGLDADDEGDEVPSEEVEDDAGTSEFAAWVQSIPSDWGCVKGRVISAHAAGDKAGFEGPSYDSIDEAIGALGLEGRCVEVARARVNGSDDEVTSRSEAGPAQAPSSRPGPPAHAQAPRSSADAGSASGSARAEAGPPADRGAGGPPADRGQAGPPADRGQAGPPADRGNGGPPAGRGGR